MKKFLLAAIVLAVPTISVAGDFLSPDAVEALAMQYLYMNECPDFPPLPQDRLNVIDAMTEMVDKQDLLKATVRLVDQMHLADKAKVAVFCSRMADMIKNEPGHRQ